MNFNWKINIEWENFDQLLRLFLITEISFLFFIISFFPFCEFIILLSLCKGQYSPIFPIAADEDEDKFFDMNSVLL